MANLLDLIAKYKHLADPFYSFTRLGTWDSQAPSGKWALSKNPKVNLGLWNAIGVASWALPTSALAIYFANKYWDKKMRDADDDGLKSRLAMLRPTISPDKSLEELNDILNNPEEWDAELAKDLVKTAADAEDDDPIDPKEYEGKTGRSVSKWVGGLAAGALPVIALPASMLAAKYAMDKIYEKRLKDRLKSEREAIRNAQNKVDYEILKAQGLIKGASSDKDDKEVLKEHEKTLREAQKAQQNPFATLVSLPITAGLLSSLFLGALGIHALRKSDKAIGLLKYTKDKMYGRNWLQQSPEISVEELGLKNSDIIARPGDKKNPTYIDEEPSAAQAKPSASAQLEELKSVVSPEGEAALAEATLEPLLAGSDKTLA